jgi:hypothetical protein
MVNQTDEVEFIRHSRQLAADSVQGKKKSAVGHRFENAIEAPRRYNDFQRTATTPLTLCLSPGVHFMPPLPPAPPNPAHTVPLQCSARHQQQKGTFLIS